MNIKKDLTLFKVVGDKAQKNRWDAVVEVADLVKRKPIQISTLMKGMTMEQIEGFYKTAKTFTDPEINFWVLWRENRPV